MVAAVGDGRESSADRFYHSVVEIPCSLVTGWGGEWEHGVDRLDPEKWRL